MGAWGSGPFDNDDAADWLAELEDRGIEAIAAAFDAIPSDVAQYVEIPECSAAVAAAEVLAIMRGNESGRIPSEVENWAADQE